MSEKLKVGDLVYYKNYFCEVVEINEDTHKFRWVNLKRKFRSDGSKIKSTWGLKTYADWIRRADLDFQRVIEENLKLLEIYKMLRNGKI